MARDPNPPLGLHPEGLGGGASALNEPPPTKAKIVFAYALAAAVVLSTIVEIIGKSYVTPVFWTPFVVGFTCGVARLRHPYRITVGVYVAFALILLFTWREGAACMAMATPILLLLCFLGTFTGRVLGRVVRDRRARQASALLVFLAIGAWQVAAIYLDDPAKHPWHEVSTAIDVSAPPEAVFALLTDPEGVELSSSRWPAILHVGLPIPRRMQVVKPGEGGSLFFDFNHGSAEAKIRAWVPGRLLSFEPARYLLDDPPLFQTRLGDGPHRGLKTERVTDWLTFGLLSYDIVPLPSGGSRLVRVTRFQRHLFPGFYFGAIEEKVIAAGSRSLLLKLAERLGPTAGIALKDP